MYIRPCSNKQLIAPFSTSCHFVKFLDSGLPQDFSSEKMYRGSKRVKKHCARSSYKSNEGLQPVLSKIVDLYTLIILDQGWLTSERLKAAFFDVILQSIDGARKKLLGG